MKIDIISDTVCPWCFVGKRRLEKALIQRPEVGFVVEWRPFQLNPGLPPEGMERQAYLAAKLGSAERATAIYAQISDAARPDNIEFNFEGIKQSPNTLASHCLIRWGATAGVQNLVVETLFKAFFEDGRDIGDKAVLAEIADECGMEKALVQDLLARDADVELIQKEEAIARDMGISGVPFFIFDGKYSTSGAQDPQMFLQIIDKLVEEQAEQAAAN